MVSKPSSRARASATETTRSLNEWVGLAASFLTHTSLAGRARSASRSARSSGVQPAGSVPLRRRLDGQEVAVAPQRVRARPGSGGAARPDRRRHAAA